MERWEYLQISVNYYSLEAWMVNPSNDKDSDVWQGLRNYLDVLNQEGWIIINETSSDRARIRTFHLKKPVE